MARVLERPLIEAKFINWLLIGVMWLGNEIVPQIWGVLNGGEWDWIMMFIALPIWLVSGFAWGLGIHFFMNRKGKKADRHESG